MSTITAQSDEVKNLHSKRDRVLARAEGRIANAERQKRTFESWEQRDQDADMKEVSDLNQKIEAAKVKATPTKTLAEYSAEIAKHGVHTTRRNTEQRGGESILPKTFSRDYWDDFHGHVSGTGKISGSLYEGASTAGGFAVPITVDNKVVPLAPVDLAVRSISRVIVTSGDLKVGQAVTRGAFAAKTETSAFPVAQPSLSQVTLSAFAAGVEYPISLELAQDAPYFEDFLKNDLATAYAEFEAPLFIGGSGTGQPQGLLGNVGLGITAEPDGNGNLVSIAATLGVLGSLKASYHGNACWLMERSTSLIIRAAQAGSNLFQPVFTRENGTDLLHGYPIKYDTAMPAAARGATPVLFGDFFAGYRIADRQGSALIVKVIEQDASLAQQGVILLLGYKRIDARVVRAEAIQAITIAAS